MLGPVSKKEPASLPCPVLCPAGFFLMTPSRAELARFHSLLLAGAVPIAGYAEQDFLNGYFKESLRERGLHLSAGSL
jgi:hypothetical protein